MKKNEIKQKLINEDYILTSSIKDKVMNKVGLKKERKPLIFKRLYGSLALAFSLILVFSLFIIKRPENYYTIFVDINPSISLKVNTKELVKEVTPLNEDGIIFINDLELLDKNLNDAIDIIVNEAINVGYFTDDFANISVSTFGKEEDKAIKVNEQIEQRLKQRVGNIVITDLSEDAEELGVSKGKMTAINKALEADQDLTLEKALKMNEKQLLDKIEDKARKQQKDFDDKFKFDDKDETRIIHVINQMNSIIQNIKNRPGKQNEAYFKFKGLYDEYNMLIDKVSEDFLNTQIVKDFEIVLEEETDILDIVNNLDDNKETPGGPGKNDDNDKPNPGGPGKNDDEEKPNPGGPGKHDDEENPNPGGPGKHNDEENPNQKGPGKHDDEENPNQKGSGKQDDEKGNGGQGKSEESEENGQNKQNKNNNNK